jgi:hypothetical protein
VLPAALPENLQKHGGDSTWWINMIVVSMVD